ncbi:hypothetical protein D7Y15_17475 [Corallococcus sp. AB030]|nr:hypothetical protein D7Y15_17475 [Corallococcus sp. AB030]
MTSVSGHARAPTLRARRALLRPAARCPSRPLTHAPPGTRGQHRNGAETAHRDTNARLLDTPDVAHALQSVEGMPFSWRFRRRMRLVGLGLCALGLMFVGLLAAMEGMYQVLLRRLPSLPTPPSATDRLPANLARVYWSLYEPGGSMTVKPVRPWTVAWTVTRTIVSKPSRMDVPPGWTLADTVARRWHPEGSARLLLHERLTLGIWLTRHWTAEELLAFEARRMPLGHGLRDLPEAARHYLGKEASDLTLAEAALLVTMNDDPRWRKHPECFIDRLQPRRDGRLRRMRMAGSLTPEEEAEARAWPVVLDIAPLARHPCPPP